MSDLDKAVAEVAAKYSKTDLARAALSIARDSNHWQAIALMSLLLNIWLAHLAGVLCRFEPLTPCPEDGRSCLSKRFLKWRRPKKT